jgi:hypothetical protein
MKHLLTLAAVLPFTSATAQTLLNGSFESGGAPSFANWEWTCSDPAPIADAPQGGGTWSAWKEPGQAKGCFPSYLFQRISDMPYGAPVVVSGWVKCPQDEFNICLGGSIGFGTINGGIITPIVNTASTDPDWTYVTCGHVFDPGAGDTAIVMLGAGFIGGPIQPSSAGLDLIALDIAEAVDEQGTDRLQHFPDPAADVLYLASDLGGVSNLEVFDLTGRKVLNAQGGMGTQRIDVGALPAGRYLLRGLTGRGPAVASFIKQ